MRATPAVCSQNLAVTFWTDGQGTHGRGCEGLRQYNARAHWHCSSPAVGDPPRGTTNKLEDREDPKLVC
eukprot:Skav207699  [mRNA]  locus=scaffold3057:221032:221238:+ [translate_table: standard]